jgi:hypothetical protein
VSKLTLAQELPNHDKLLQPPAAVLLHIGRHDKDCS